MSRDISPLQIRMPDEVKKAIETAAAGNRRSINAEVVQRLEQSLEGNDAVLAQFTAGQLLDELIRRREPGVVTIEIFAAPQRKI